MSEISRGLRDPLKFMTLKSMTTMTTLYRKQVYTCIKISH